MTLGEGMIDETYKVTNDHLVLIVVPVRVKDQNGVLKVMAHKP